MLKTKRRLCFEIFLQIIRQLAWSDPHRQPIFQWTLYNSYNRKYHKTTDGIINDEVLDNMDRIKICPIKIDSEEDLTNEIARIANLSLKKGYQIEDEKRLLTRDEAYEQISDSASLFKAILEYVEKVE